MVPFPAHSLHVLSSLTIVLAPQVSYIRFLSYFFIKELSRVLLSLVSQQWLTTFTFLSFVKFFPSLTANSFNALPTFPMTPLSLSWFLFPGIFSSQLSLRTCLERYFSYLFYKLFSRSKVFPMVSNKKHSSCQLSIPHLSVSGSKTTFNSFPSNSSSD